MAARIAILLSLLLTGNALAHDPSAWGGAFRSRDQGANWLPVDARLFVGGALALSVNPTDPNHLLYATDTNLLRSRNGGRDWKQEGSDKLIGPTLAVSFDLDGRGAVASTAAGVFWSRDDAPWQLAKVPAGAAPARAIAAGLTPGRFYLAGPGGVFISDDHGTTWIRSGDGVVEGPVSGLLVVAKPAGAVFAVAAGQLWISRNADKQWQSASAGLPAAQVQTVSVDQQGRLWLVCGDQVYGSDDGRGWSAIGQPFPEPNTTVRGLTVNDAALTLAVTTHRGLLRSVNGGQTWALMEGTLPTHLEGGPLVRDPHDPATLYAGFSLMPYPEIWRRAEQGHSLLTQIDPVRLAGGGAALLLLGISGWLLARKLAGSAN